ncbi:hypothetical protein [Rhizobium rosettiformans]|uniref:hypothetical protein n=1 Tax=Rhizobium rosettiformans TaxID=1368430 RepID=UPI0028650DEF|nr:hypothetical protein [Rhizobium rosettiformans]MDR7027803.1 hypothetical protein [Rhizobium rosettiformans]MDR7066367.1 hypothetical protein [Rhizobium rosettiformans]
MQHLWRLMLAVISLSATLGMGLLSGHEYGWIADIDAGLDPTTIETDGDRALVRIVLLLIALAAAAIMAAATKTATRSRYALPLVLSLLAIATYGFGGR